MNTCFCQKRSTLQTCSLTCACEVNLVLAYLLEKPERWWHHCAHIPFLNIEVLDASVAGEHMPCDPYRDSYQGTAAEEPWLLVQASAKEQGFFLGLGHVEKPCPGFSCHLPFQVKVLRQGSWVLSEPRAGRGSQPCTGSQASIKVTSGTLVQILCLSPKCSSEIFVLLFWFLKPWNY